MNTLSFERLLKAGGTERIKSGVVVVEGPQAAEFLQGQLANEISGLELGGSVQSLVLEPDGKVNSLISVRRRAQDFFELLPICGSTDTVLERLKRFFLRTRARIDVEQRSFILFWGEAAQNVSQDQQPFEATSGRLVRKIVESDEELPDFPTGAHERARIAAGGWGPNEVKPGLIAYEIEGLCEVAASLTKGCYVGQELMARLDSRGRRVPRHLKKLVSLSCIKPGEKLVEKAEEVGEITSVQACGEFYIALGFVHRKSQSPVIYSEGESHVAVVDLYFTGEIGQEHLSLKALN